MSDELAQPKSWTPVPDPTVLTTAQVIREIGSLQTSLNQKIDANRDLHQQRFEAIAKAVELLQAHADKQPSADVLGEQIVNLHNVMEQKFDNVDAMFRERDKGSQEMANATKVAVDAAFSAAKELYNKQNEFFAATVAESKETTTKQVDALNLLISTALAGFNDKVTDLKDRITRIESKTTGGKELWIIISGVIIFVIVVAGFLVQNFTAK